MWIVSARLTATTSDMSSASQVGADDGRGRKTMNKNEPNCADCVHRYRLENWHYHEAWHKGKYGMEVKHTEMNGFVCDIFANEGLMAWLTGASEGGCDMYERREE